MASFTTEQGLHHDYCKAFDLYPTREWAKLTAQERQAWRGFAIRIDYEMSTRTMCELAAEHGEPVKNFPKRTTWPEPRLSHKVERALEEAVALRHEAVRLLDLIASEFASDPMSALCFDLRIVEQAKAVSKRLKQLAHADPLWGESL